jgi:hypothetical protein
MTERKIEQNTTQMNNEHPEFHSAMKPSEVPTKSDVVVKPGTCGDDLMRAIINAEARVLSDDNYGGSK